jgi:hypothetical protein
MLVFIYSWVIRACNFFKIEKYADYLLVIIQCFIYALTGYLTIKIAEMVTNSKKFALYSYIIYIALVGLSPWVVIPYSDSTGLWIPITMLYLITSLLKKKRGFVIKLFCFGLLAYFGYKIKPQCLITVIAAFIVAVIAFCRKKNLKKLRIGVLCFTAGILCSVAVCQTAINSLGFKLDTERTFGFEHFLMMGLNPETNGVYSEADFMYSSSFDTKKDRNAANLEVVKERLRSYSLSGFAKFMRTKTLINYNDGTFAWGQEGGFFDSIIQDNASYDGKLSSFAKSLYYEGNANYDLYTSFAQMLWLVVLILSIAAGLKNNIDYNGNLIVLIMLLSIIGLTVFEWLFEARARYLFTYAPFYVILSTIGLKNIYILFKPIYAKVTKRFSVKHSNS